MNKDRSLKDVLMKILKEYNFEEGPLFNLSSKLRLHSSLVDQSPFLDNGDLEIRLNQERTKTFSPLTSTGLKLLRSLFQDHQDTREDCLFPCTGNHKSLNWSILHKDGLVTVKANESMETTYYYLQYKREVLGFIKEVEDFYKKSDKNTLSKDKVKRKEYLAFWKEWNSLKEKATL